MFFFAVMGTKPSVKGIGKVNFTCDICKKSQEIYVTRKSQTFQIFFIDVCRYSPKYFGSCSNCASLYLINNDIGKKIEKGEISSLSQSDITILKNGFESICPNCKNNIKPNDDYCSHCGTRLK